MARPVSKVLGNDHFSTLLRHCLAPKHRTTPFHYPSSDYYSVHARFTTNRIVVSSRKRSLRVRQGAHYIKRQNYSIRKHGRPCLLEQREQPQKLRWKDEARKITLPDFRIPTSIVCDIVPKKLFAEGASNMRWIRTTNKYVSPETLLSKHIPLALPLLGPTLVNSTRDEINCGKDVQKSERAPEQSDRATPAQLSFVLFKLREEVMEGNYSRSLVAVIEIKCHSVHMHIC